MIVLLVFLLKGRITPEVEQPKGQTAADIHHIMKEKQKPKLDQIEITIEQMTLEEKIGQLFIAGMEGTTVDDRVREKIQDYALGGMILFETNLDKPEQSLQLLNDLKQIENNQDIPLFLSVDQEGGRVTRLPNLEPLRSAAEIGTLLDEEEARNNGELIARQLKAYGFQVNFAPVLDIDSNPDNTVIGDRSFGDDATTVSDMGIAMMQGYQEENIITAIKHFPGHGDTKEDSHVELPVLDKTKAELVDHELSPFKAAIDAGADMVLVAHILIPDLDKKYPASMSKETIDILRKDWNYDGVVITDDLTMGAITDHHSMDEVTVKAIQAGADILMIAHGKEELEKGFSGLKEAVETGDISEERIDESVRRILQLKEEYHVNDDLIEEVNVDVLNEEIEDVYGESSVEKQ